MEGIEFVYLEKDVVRHRLVKEIIRAYEESENSQTEIIKDILQNSKGENEKDKFTKIKL